MNCPVCSTELRVADRQGIEIDFCPKCRGIWLDRGELEKIIERSSSQAHPDDDYDDDDGDRRQSGWRSHDSPGNGAMRGHSHESWNYSERREASIHGRCNMLVLSRKVGDQIVISNNILLTVLEVSGNRVRLGFTAPSEVVIWRGELQRGQALPSLEEDPNLGTKTGDSPEPR